MPNQILNIKNLEKKTHIALILLYLSIALILLYPSIALSLLYPPIALILPAVIHSGPLISPGIAARSLCPGAGPGARQREALARPGARQLCLKGEAAVKERRIAVGSEAPRGTAARASMAPRVTPRACHVPNERAGCQRLTQTPNPQSRPANAAQRAPSLF